MSRRPRQRVCSGLLVLAVAAVVVTACANARAQAEPVAAPTPPQPSSDAAAASDPASRQAASAQGPAAGAGAPAQAQGSPATPEAGDDATPPAAASAGASAAGSSAVQGTAPPAGSTPATGSTPEAGPAAATPPPPSYGELSAPPPPPAVEGEWDPWDNPTTGGRQHDGFFLRLSFGFGFGAVATGDALSTGEAIDFSGGAAGGSLAIGATIVSSLSLHVDFFFSRLLNPAVEGGRSRFDYGDPGMGAAGIGLTYHFRNNLYVGASGGLASVNWERQTGEVSESEAGVGGHMIVGKEWWVDPEWGVGIAAQAVYASADDPYYASVSFQAYHLLLSATYN